MQIQWFLAENENLHQWIYSTWIENCEVHLCSKGFFTVKFDTPTILECVLKEGPWFWGMRVSS